jgi:hypothetical protein
MVGDRGAAQQSGQDSLKIDEFTQQSKTKEEQEMNICIVGVSGRLGSYMVQLTATG